MKLPHQTFVMFWMSVGTLYLARGLWMGDWWVPTGIITALVLVSLVSIPMNRSGGQYYE